MTTNFEQIEVEWLKTEIIPKLLKEQKLLSDITEKDLDKFQINNITVQLIGSQEAFMLTQCYRAGITYEYKGAVDEIRFFVKKTPTLPQDIFDVINFKALFTNEILAYEEIIPALESFGNINLNTSKFYYSDLQSNSATVIIEDFTSKSWSVTKDRYNLSLEHALLAVKYLAKFHAAGFALRQLDQAQFEKITENLMESRYASEILHPEWVLSLKTGVERVLKATRKYEKSVTGEFLSKFENCMENAIKYCKELVQQPKGHLVTLCHGDYLRNNVAYKYDIENAKIPTDIMMYDLQTLRVSSPMVDLSIFLSLSTLAEVRHKHFEEIFNSYCEQIWDTYKTITKQPVPEYLSHDSLLREYIRFLPFSTFTCASFLLELVEPDTVSSEERLTAQRTDEDVIRKCLHNGGAIVDHELAHQMKEMFELSRQHNVDLF